jgi:hypothetical protein
MMAILVAGGILPQAAAWFGDVASLYVSAIAAEQSMWAERVRASGEALDEQAMAERVRQAFAALPPSTYPMLSSLADVMTAGSGEERFEFGLDLLVAGLEVVSARMAGSEAGLG